MITPVLHRCQGKVFGVWLRTQPKRQVSDRDEKFEASNSRRSMTCRKTGANVGVALQACVPRLAT
jgi:hypothetical protein